MGVSSTDGAESVVLGGMMGVSITSAGEPVVLGAGGGALMGVSSTSSSSSPAPPVGTGGTAMGVSSTSAAELVALGAYDAHENPLADALGRPALEPDGADDGTPDDGQP
jgi:hypothetical protein